LLFNCYDEGPLEEKKELINKISKNTFKLLEESSTQPKIST